VPTKFSVEHILQNLEVKNDFLMLNMIFSTQNWAFYANLIKNIRNNLE